MTTWVRASRTTLCGRCGELIAVGDSMRELRLTGIASVKVRCAACAGEPAPELPPLTSRVLARAPAAIAPRARPSMTPLKDVMSQYLSDWKQKAAGE